MEEYFKFTEYRHSNAALKRLNFIVDECQKYVGYRCRSKIRILDVGCGLGNITLPLASLGFNILGIDIDRKSIEHARSVNQFQNASFQVMDVNNLKLSSSFDIIICSEVLEHLAYPSHVLYSISKFLNPIGILLITIPNGYGPMELSGFPIKGLRMMGFSNMVYKMKRLIFRQNPDLDSFNQSFHLQRYSLGSFRKMLRDCGFSVIACYRGDFLNSTMPFSLFTRGKNKFAGIFQYYDCKLADELPLFAVSSWYFVTKKLKL